MPGAALISIIDDDQSLREAVKALMRSLGLTAETFASAEDFLNSDSLHRTACLIVDVQMPGMSGPDLHHRLVTSGKPIPTILITAYPDNRARARALQAGVIGYLAKPFEESDLLACIRSAIGDAGGGGKDPRDSALPG